MLQKNVILELRSENERLKKQLADLQGVTVALRNTNKELRKQFFEMRDERDLLQAEVDER